MVAGIFALTTGKTNGTGNTRTIPPFFFVRCTFRISVTCVDDTVGIMGLLSSIVVTEMDVPTIRDINVPEKEC